MLKIYDRDKVSKGILNDYFDYHIEHTLDLDDRTLYFTALIKDVKELVEVEGYIENKEDIFVINEVVESTDGQTVDVVAKLDMEALEGKSFTSFKTTEQTIESALQLAFAGTGWTISSSNITKKRTLSMTNSSALQILSQATKTYRAEIKVNSMAHSIAIYDKVGSNKGVYFSSRLNLKKLDVQTTSNDFYTEIEPYGKDGLNISSVNNGQTFLSNHQYSTKKKRYIWKDERYTVPDSLKEDAAAKLSDMSKPYVSYTVEIIELSHVYPFLSYDIGDIVTIINSVTGTKEEQRIVKIDHYPKEPINDVCTLANKTLTFDEKAQKYETTSSTVDNITNDNGQIDGDAIDGIHSDQIVDLENAIVSSATIINLTSQYLEVTGKLTAVEADIGSLNANIANIEQAVIGKLDATEAEITYAKIEDLEAVNAQIGTLETEYLNVSEQLTALNGSITNLESEYANIQQALIGKLDAEVAKITYATITELNAAKADISNIEVDTANIKTLLSGNAGVGDLQNIHLTTQNAVIDNALVKNAVIQTVSVNDLLAGTISTNKFTITSDDGGISINGSTQQWKDQNGVVRVQIGKDASGNFTFSLFDETGEGVLIDSTGIKPGAIANGLIVNDMVADDAAIAGSKLDIESVFESMNDSVYTLNSNKIWFDDKKQSLTQIYSQIETSIQLANETASSAASTANEALETISGISTLDAISAVLTNDSHVIHTNTDGSGGNYSDCITQINIYSGDTNVSEDAYYEVFPSIGVTGLWDSISRTYSVTGMTTDDGYVDITALYGTENMYLLSRSGGIFLTRSGKNLVVRSGGSHMTKRFSISKSPDGKIGISYSLRCSTLAIRKDRSGGLAPSFVNFSSIYNDGSSIISYSGRFKIEESSDSKIYVTKYESLKDEYMIDYEPSSSNIKSIRCTLFASGNGAELDRQEIIVLVDADGLPEEIDEINEGIQIINNRVTSIETSVNGFAVDISDIKTSITGITDSTLLYNVSYKDNSNGTVTLTAFLYKEGIDVKTSYSDRWFTWYKKNESQDLTFVGYGYNIAINKDSVGFGTTYVGVFTTYDEHYMTTRSGIYLTTRSGNRLTTWVEN